MSKLLQISPVIFPLETAQSITKRAMEKIAEIGVPYTLTVVDGAGNLVLATRMDGAAIASIDTSLAKARTAIYFGATTKELGNAVVDKGPLATIQTSASVPLAFVAGGIPIRDSAGVVVGGLGAGGASPEQDHEVATYALGL
ncbi:heme-binding protein [Rhizobium sp.]|uniref:heme-binding protein n=1 Tax=Rhizobium sp. TaxID=391 RepID=UPI0034C5F42D